MRVRRRITRPEGPSPPTGYSSAATAFWRVPQFAGWGCGEYQNQSSSTGDDRRDTRLCRCWPTRMLERDVCDLASHQCRQRRLVGHEVEQPPADEHSVVDKNISTGVVRRTRHLIAGPAMPFADWISSTIPLRECSTSPGTARTPEASNMPRGSDDEFVAA
jgi:hypothetical protein